MRKNKIRMNVGSVVFDIFNVTLLVFLAFSCLAPLINILAVSLSSRAPVEAGQVLLWPVNFTLTSYRFMIEKPAFWQAFYISIKRVLIGAALNMFSILTMAYPLSRETKDFRWRPVYLVFFFITMLIGGGLIPTYMVIKELRLLDTIWALVLPGTASFSSSILLLNFIRNQPKEIEEAAFIDGAGHWINLILIQTPLAKPAIATLALFAIVGHWNSWFDGLIYLNNKINYPLASYLQIKIITRQQLMEATSPDEIRYLLEMSERTGVSAQIFIGLIPILVVYPFLQKYFAKGIVLGSIKG